MQGYLCIISETRELRVYVQQTLIQSNNKSHNESRPGCTDSVLFTFSLIFGPLVLYPLYITL